MYVCIYKRRYFSTSLTSRTYEILCDGSYFFSIFLSFFLFKEKRQNYLFSRDREIYKKKKKQRRQKRKYLQKECTLSTFRRDCDYHDDIRRKFKGWLVSFIFSSFQGGEDKIHARLYLPFTKKDSLRSFDIDIKSIVSVQREDKAKQLRLGLLKPLLTSFVDVI